MNISKLQISVAAAASILVALLTAAGTYYKAMGDLREEFHIIRLETEQEYVKKDELLRFEQRLERIQTDVAEIKGYLRRQHDPMKR